MRNVGKTVFQSTWSVLVIAVAVTGSASSARGQARGLAAANVTSEPDTEGLGRSLAVPRMRATLIKGPPSTHELEAAQQAATTPRKGRLCVGIHRRFSEPLEIGGPFGASRDWTLLPDGRRFCVVEVTSQGAAGLRVQLRALSLPRGARIIVYDPAEPGAPALMAAAEEANGTSETWTPTIFSEKVVVECQASPGVAVEQIRFSINSVSHLLDTQWKAGEPKIGGCHNDVSCYPKWLQAASSVARILFVEAGNSYTCTGSLLASASPAATAELLLTAYHCVGGPEAAATMEAFWLFQTDQCGGPAPAPASVPRTTGGADYLAGSATADFALLRLRRAPPAGAFYLGWSVGPLTPGESVVTIHHPGSSYKRISFGNTTTSQKDFHVVRWSSGVTEAGSSGAPLLNESGQLIGQLYGGRSSCSEPMGADTFGRFDVAYPFLRPWLDAAPQPAPLPPVEVPRGSYSGLFQSEKDTSAATAGQICVSVGRKGIFTGAMKFAGMRLPFSGRFENSGSAAILARPEGQPPLSIELRLESAEPARLVGTVLGEGWRALLRADCSAYEAVTKPAPQAGRYTVVVSGGNGSSGAPPGSGYSVVAVSRAGMVRVSGRLPDGAVFVQSARLSEGGEWPLYVPLYGGRGLMVGWVELNGMQGSGQPLWIRPATPYARYTGPGFAIRTALTASRYAGGTPILQLPAGSLTLSGGTLTEPVVNPISIQQNNTVKNLGQSRLSLTLRPATGVFTGDFRSPVLSGPVRFSGVVLQHQGRGYGYFLQDGAGGVVQIFP